MADSTNQTMPSASVQPTGVATRDYAVKRLAKQQVLPVQAKHPQSPKMPMSFSPLSKRF